MSYRTVRLDLSDAVATLTLARPDRMNALTPLLFDEASAAIDEGLAGGARALILTGEGKAFCSGADMIPDESYGGLPEDLGVLLEAHYNPFARKLADLDIPVVSAINGPAVGAGMSIALAADISVMAKSAYLLLAFVNIGLVPDAGVTWLIAKGAGRAKALELALLGEKVSAEEAQAIGLVNRVVDDEAVLDEARAIALRLARGPSVAVGMIRKQVAAALGQTLAETLDAERHNQGKAGRTADFREAVAAFGEKRKPIFKGR